MKVKLAGLPGGAIKTSGPVPVTVAFDYERPVGYARVNDDGTADLELKEGTSVEGCEFSIGYRVLDYEQDGDTRTIKAIEVFTVALLTPAQVYR